MEISSEDLSKRKVLIANCPVAGYGEYVVSASSTGADENELYLSLYVFGNSVKEPLNLIKRLPVSLPFTALSWTPLGEETEEHYLGFIIGGHADGSVSLWDALLLVTGEEEGQGKDFACKGNFGLFNSPVNSISMNVKPNLFGVGSDHVSIVSIDKTYQCSVAVTCDPPSEGGSFTSLSWNPKVNHILAGSTSKGSTYIYDMKKKAIFLEISEQSAVGEVYSQGHKSFPNVLWYVDGAQVIIAFDSNECNFLTQFHMKQPNAPSAMYQNGHSSGIVDLRHNPFDKNFFITAGRDHVITCWSMRTKRAINSVKIQVPCSQVIWSRKIKDCFIYAGFNGKLYSQRLNFASDMSLYEDGQEIIPNWFIKKSVCCFGFGNKLFKYSKINPGDNKENNIKVLKLAGDKDFIETAKKFHEMIEGGDINALLDSRISSSKSSQSPSLPLFWAALKSLSSQDFESLFAEMGLPLSELRSAIDAALGRKATAPKKRQLFVPGVEENEEDLGKLFEKPVEKGNSRKGSVTGKDSIGKEEGANLVSEEIVRNMNWNTGNEKLIKKCLLVGDLESAVELLFKNDRSSEALLIASTQPELFQKAKDMYMQREKDLFVKSIFPAIINSNFDLLFSYNVIKEWKEYLLYAKTYIKDQTQFMGFAETLGDKLSSYPDVYCAVVCYLMAGKFEKILELLYQYYLKESEKNGKESKYLLHNLFEQIYITNQIMNNNKYTNEKYNKIIYDYTTLLIHEGLNNIAGQYLTTILSKSSDSNISDLYERLYYNCENEFVGKLPVPESQVRAVILKSHINNRGNDKKMPGNLRNPRSNMGNMNNNIIPNNMSNNTNNIVNRQVPMSRPQPKLIEQNNKHPVPSFNNIHRNVPENKEDLTSSNGFVKKTGFNFGGGQGRVVKPPSVVSSQIRNIKPPTVMHPNMPSSINKFQQPEINNQYPPSNSQHNVKTSAFNQSPAPAQVEEKEEIPLNQDEQTVYEYFSNIVEVYNSAYKDPNKQKDFGSKISVLLAKINNHEIKMNLLKLLEEFMSLNEKGDTKSMKKLLMRIQSIDWDRNKGWMPLLERLLNMKR